MKAGSTASILPAKTMICHFVSRSVSCKTVLVTNSNNCVFVLPTMHKLTPPLRFQQSGQANKELQALSFCVCWKWEATNCKDKESVKRTLSLSFSSLHTSANAECLPMGRPQSSTNLPSLDCHNSKMQFLGRNWLTRLWRQAQEEKAVCSFLQT